ncbi:MAG: AAA family ATPase [Methanothrix sp.]|jgi:hypothetical protein|nr:MAG: AAA family ATPase [Methanothrix sp.]
MNSSSRQTQPEATNPASTGGAGTFFEQHVNAAFLALLLVRGIPPCLEDCQIKEVHFQTAHLGWNTDDLLVVGKRRDESERHLAAQIKRKFHISSKNEDCRETIASAWRDFQSEGHFDKSNDLIVIISLQSSERLLANFGNLLDCARVSLDAADFLQRTEVPKFLSKITRDYRDEIRKIVEVTNEGHVDDDNFWEFLKSLRILPFDRQTEYWMKIILAEAARGPNELGIAEATWNELLSLVGSTAPNAGSFTYDKLPERLQQNHSPIGDSEHDAIRVLRDHSQVVLNNISDTIWPDHHIPRGELCTQLLQSLERSHVVVITGPPGSGKSAIAKEVVEKLSQNHLALSFRAEAFATAHLDETLHNMQIPAPITSKSLFSLLALRSRKLILVESIERLLERSNRDAFSDFLGKMLKDDDWKMILTCRDYSLDLVCEAFLEAVGLKHEVFTVPLLDDAELDKAIAAIPKLKRPSKNPALRKLFRNPYILNMAARMQWAEDANIPQDERSFRSKVWRDIVREDDKPAGGMPKRREEVFTKIALLRARALSPYANCDGLDQEVLERLHQDNLIEFSERTDSLAAPAHDVLEDWALVDWLEERFAHHHLSGHSSFLQNVGTHPALRRAYRKWLGEMLECEPKVADKYVLKVISDRNLAQQSRDDTLVSVMLSSGAADFNTRNDEILLQNDAELLRRMVHLLRVACKIAPSWVPIREASSAIFVPQGSAWAAILKLIHQNLTKFHDGDIQLLVGLLEDWSQTVNWWDSPYPEGSEDAAEIAFSLLSKTDYWRQEGTQKQLLKIIAKIPKASSNNFEELVQRAIDHNKKKDHTSNELAKLLLMYLDGGAACRDFPDLIIKLAESKWIDAPEPKDKKDCDFYGGRDIESIFGLREHLDFDFFPASAYHGPFIFLLRYHPKIGLKFIVRLLNHCSNCYADREISREFVEFVEYPFKVTFQLADGTNAEQWCSDRLWLLYRGTSTGPHVIQSALMALESWLLELCELNSPQVEQVLNYLLKGCNNVAITAVVASIATAYPKQAKQAALSLLTCPYFIKLDIWRVVHEQSTPTSIFSYFPIMDKNRIYIEERKTADSLEHRRLHLEKLALQLQFGPYRNEVWQILDQHYQELPPTNQQTEDDFNWRLSLLRMDLRRMKFQKADNENKILLLPNPEPDIQEYLAKDAPSFEAYNNRISLNVWAMSTFKREKDSKPEEWRQRLAQAQHVHLELENMSHSIERQMGAAGPTCTAAICVRDYWDELSQKERDWCIEVVLQSVFQSTEASYSIDGSLESAFILPALLSKELSEDTIKMVQEALSLSLNHASERVVVSAAEGVGTFLWQADKEMTLTCMAAVIYAAKLQRDFDLQEKTKPYSERLSREEKARDIAKKISEFIHKRESLDEQELFDLDLFEAWGQESLLRLIPILYNGPQGEMSRKFFRYVADSLVGWWNKYEGSRGDTHEYRNYELESGCMDRLARFALKLEAKDAAYVCEPIINAVCFHPKEVAEFVRSLTIYEDIVGSGSVFWGLWEAISDKMATTTWIENLDKRNSDRIALLDALFLGLSWDKGLRHWQRLEGNAWRLDRFFDKLAPSSAVLVAYSRFLYRIGEKSLPGAFEIISKKLQQGDPRLILSNENSVFYLESILRRWVYGQPASLKSDSSIRDSVIYLLNELVESGSSSAYKMRDDFVTPISP